MQQLKDNNRNSSKSLQTKKTVKLSTNKTKVKKSKKPAFKQTDRHNFKKLKKIVKKNSLAFVIVGLSILVVLAVSVFQTYTLLNPKTQNLAQASKNSPWQQKLSLDETKFDTDCSQNRVSTISMTLNCQVQYKGEVLDLENYKLKLALEDSQGKNLNKSKICETTSEI